MSAYEGSKMQEAAEDMARLARETLQELRDHYSVEVLCDNCMIRSKVTIKKGVTVESALGEIVCPNCNCTTLKPKWGARV